MDALRSAYTTEMQFFDPPGPAIPVRWYFCADDAEAFPFWNRFGSGNWAYEKFDWFGPGQISHEPHPWADGNPPGPPTIRQWASVGPEAHTNTGNALTSTFTFPVVQGMTVLVAVFYFNTVGPAGFLSVTDTAGNVYQLDHTVTCPTVTQAAMDVWRCKIAISAPLAKLVFDFFGSSKYISFAGGVFDGLEDAGPTASSSATGAALTNPAIEPLTTNAGNQLIFASYVCNWSNTFVAYPATMFELGHITSNATFEDGGAAYMVTTKETQTVAGEWEVTTFQEWASVALAYQGVPKLRLPGKTFCGAREYWEHGAPDTENPLVTDIYGVSTCCGKDLPFFLSCNKVIDDLLELEITAIYFHGADTTTFVGQKLQFEKNLLGTWWMTQASIDAMGDPIAIDFHGAEFKCLVDVFTLQTFPAWPACVATYQRLNPIGLKFNFWRVGLAMTTPNDMETWDCFIRITPK